MRQRLKPWETDPQHFKLNLYDRKALSSDSSWSPVAGRNLVIHNQHFTWPNTH